MKKATSEPLLLLDLNVLRALAWPNHQFHQVATQRLQSAEEAWATCALTQLGFIRLSSDPAVVGVSKSPSDAAALLEALVGDSRHRYLDTLPSPVSASSRASFQRILGYQQITDAYLLALAQRYDAKLVTFDQRILALAMSKEQVEILSPMA